MLLDSRVMTVRKLFRKLHLWLSLPFGLIIMTTCLTGALLVFEKEITELVRHDSYTIPVRKTQSLSLQSLLERVAARRPIACRSRASPYPLTSAAPIPWGSLSLVVRESLSIPIRERSWGRAGASPSSRRCVSCIAGYSIV